MYAEYLRLSQFSVVEIDDTAGALRLAATVDVIVTGILVPGPFDGVELIRRVRLDELTRRKPVIVLTACVLKPDEIRAWEAGCDAFLPKPCLPDRLGSEIRRVLRLSSVGGERPVRANWRISTKDIA